MRAAAALALLLLAACADAADLRAPPRALAGDETAAVRRKADQAVAEARFSDAWNLEAQAGTDRDRLEAIAVAALEADRGPYEEMLAALRARFGGLSPAARARVDAAAKAKEDAGRWKAAAQIQIVAADDAPAYAAAWRVYDRTPVRDALAVLEAIQEARADLEEERAGTPPR